MLLWLGLIERVVLSQQKGPNMMTITHRLDGKLVTSASSSNYITDRSEYHHTARQRIRKCFQVLPRTPLRSGKDAYVPHKIRGDSERPTSKV